MGDLQSPALPLGYVANSIRFQPKPRICPHSRQSLFDCLYLYFACAKRSVSVIHYPRPALLGECITCYMCRVTHKLFLSSLFSVLLALPTCRRREHKKKHKTQSKALSSEPLVGKGKTTKGRKSCVGGNFYISHTSCGLWRQEVCALYSLCSNTNQSITLCI